MDQDSRIPAILFCVTLAMALIVVGAWLVGERDSAELSKSASPASWAIPHSGYPTMEEGGPGLDRNGPVFWLGCAFGLLQLVFYTFCLLLGMKKRGGPGPTVRPLLLVGLGWAVVWSGLFWSYYSYMTEGGGSFVLGLPPATAWMLYGAWPYPVLFALYFVYIFHNWFLRKEDLQRFQQLLLERKTESAESQE
jgi:hypothetical protein